MRDRLRRLLRRCFGGPRPRVRFGSLRRVMPVNDAFALGRGEPVDRHYIEAFLAAHAADVRGEVLEFGEPRYARRFGGAGVRLSTMDRGVAGATFAGDLCDRASLPAEAFDCIICTQVLQYVADPHAALATLARALRPGGVLLLSVPAISPISRPDDDAFGERWRFTARGIDGLLGTAGLRGMAEAHGNALVALASIHGLAAGELHRAELAHRDPALPVLVVARGVKP